MSDKWCSKCQEICTANQKICENCGADLTLKGAIICQDDVEGFRDEEESD